MTSAYVATKALTAFALPLGAALLALLLAAALVRSRRATAGLVTTVVAALWACSTPFLANRLTAAAEAPYPPVKATDVPTADAIVVLGGAFALRSKDGALDFTAASDRLFVARELFMAGKAPRIVLAGGNQPYRQGWMSEAEATKRLLETLGVPGDGILTETDSVNTAENARFVGRILSRIGAKRVLLVTSAFHMRRALHEFAPTPVEVIPVPADHRADLREETWVGDFLPSADALALTSTIAKEALGLISAQLRPGS